MNDPKLFDADFTAAAKFRYRVRCAECGTDLECDPPRNPRPPHFALELRPFPCATCLDAAIQSTKAEQPQAQAV